MKNQEKTSQIFEKSNVIELSKDELKSVEGGGWIREMVKDFLCSCQTFGGSGGVGMPAGGMYYSAP